LWLRQLADKKSADWVVKILVIMQNSSKLLKMDSSGSRPELRSRPALASLACVDGHPTARFFVFSRIPLVTGTSMAEDRVVHPLIDHSFISHSLPRIYIFCTADCTIPRYVYAENMRPFGLAVPRVAASDQHHGVIGLDHGF